jgi:cell pole-organizing protein PopZ
MTQINGAKHDVEDILASIRTSIADRAPMFESEKREVRITTMRGRSAIAEEAADFELPAIFKSPAQPTSVRPNLLGRLSEALASAPPERERSRTVIPFEPLHGRMIEPPPMAREEPEKEVSSAAAEKIAADNDSQRRNMTSFFDTRMNRMGSMSQPAEPEFQPEPAPAPQPAPRSSLMAEQPQPPRLPGLSFPGEEGGHGNVEDAAAQLLRPILRQWLSENMPKIVEKALQTETGVSTNHVGPIRR